MVNVGALKTTISLDSAQFQQGMTGVNRQLKSLKQEQKAVTSSGTGFARGLTEMRSKADVLSRTFELQQGKVRELKRRYDESKLATGENSKETQKASEAYNKAVSDMNRTEDQLKNLTAEIKRQESPWTQLSEKMTSAGDTLRDVGKKTSDFGKNWSMRVTAPIVGMGALMLKTGMDFESSMSNVQAVSGATGDDLAALESAAREMGSETSKSASEAADALGYMALAGWDTEQMISGLEPVLRLSEAGAMDLGRASDLVTDSMSALQIEVKDLPAYLDNVAEASRRSNTNIDDLMEAYLVAGGNLAQFNVPLEESTALLGLLANRGLKGSEAGRSLNAIMVNLTSGAGRAGEAMEELGLSAFDSEGNFIGLEETLRLVKDRTKDMTDEQQAQYISMIAGKEHLKTFQGLLAGLDDEYGELKGNVSDADGALDEMSKTMRDNAQGNVERLKSAFQELSIQFAEHIIPVFTAGVEKAQDLVEWFSELEDDTKKNIITMAGLAATIGPAAIVAGNLTTAIGGILNVGGSLFGLLGKAGGAGLLTRIGGLGMSGPVGWGIAGLTALSGIIYAVTRDSKELNDVSFDTVLQMEEEVKATDDLIARYDELQEANKLTTDEMLEYMDILALMSETTAPDKIQDLTDRQNELLEKSGFTNEEMEEFLGLNDEIIEKAPNTAKAISEEGEAYAENTEALRNLNAEKQKEMLMHARSELIDALKNEETLIRDKKDLIAEINEQYRETNILHSDLAIAGRKVNEEEEKLIVLQGELREMEKDSLAIGSEKWLQKQDEIAQQETSLSYAEAEYSEVYNQIKALEEKFDANQENLESTREQLAEIDTMKGEYERLILEEAGLNAERGHGIDAIETQIEELRNQKKELQENTSLNDKNTDEYRKQIQEIDGQVSQLEGARSKLQEVNSLASEDVYGTKQRGAANLLGTIRTQKQEAGSLNGILGLGVNKGVNVSTSPSAYSIDSDLGRTVYKKVNVSASVVGGVAARAFGYADGTPPGGHRGGSFFAGEEGWELGRMGDRWEMLNFGVYDRPQGYEVFTHDESKKIISALNNMQVPGYATGTSAPGESDRMVNRLNDSGRGSVIYQTLNFYSKESSPAENARKTKKALKELGMQI